MYVYTVYFGLNSYWPGWLLGKMLGIFWSLDSVCLLFFLILFLCLFVSADEIDIDVQLWLWSSVQSAK